MLCGWCSGLTISMTHIPQLLRTEALGMFLSVHVGRKWSHIIVRNSREVAVKRVRNEVVEQAKVVDYPKGITEAAAHFLNPALGVAKVSDEARRILNLIIEGSYQDGNEQTT